MIVFFEKIAPLKLGSTVELFQNNHSPFDVLKSLLIEFRQKGNPLEQKLRTENINYWVTKVNASDLKSAVDIVLNEIKEYYNNPNRTNVEKLILILSIAFILTGIHVEIITLTATGSVLFLYSSHQIFLSAPNFVALEENYKAQIDSAFNTKAQPKG